MPLPPSGVAPGASLLLRVDSLQGFPSVDAIRSALPPGGEAWAKLTARLARAEAWAEAGHELAAEQLPLASLLPSDGGAAAAALSAGLALEAAKGDGVEHRETADAFELAVPTLGLVVSLDKRFGEPRSGTAPVSGPMTIALGGAKARHATSHHVIRHAVVSTQRRGSQMPRSSFSSPSVQLVEAGPWPCFWRAPTDNDEGGALGSYAEAWRTSGLSDLRVKVRVLCAWLTGVYMHGRRREGCACCAGEAAAGRGQSRGRRGPAAVSRLGARAVRLQRTGRAGDRSEDGVLALR